MYAFHFLKTVLVWLPMKTSPRTLDFVTTERAPTTVPVVG